MYSRFIQAQSLRTRISFDDAPGDEETPVATGRPETPGRGELKGLNRITIGHVVLGFLGFRQGLLREDQRDPRWRFLGPTELLALERWQELHDRGWLSAESFARAVEVLIGDRAPRMAFAGFCMMGSAVPREPRDESGASLELTAAQRRQAGEIYRELHAGIAARRGQSHHQILKELGLEARELRPLVERAATDPSARLLQRIMQDLRLAGEQQAKVVLECALLRSHVQLEHRIARGRFINLLTPIQWDVLHQLEQGQTARPSGWEGSRS